MNALAVTLTGFGYIAGWLAPALALGWLAHWLMEHGHNESPDWDFADEAIALTQTDAQVIEGPWGRV